MEQTESRRARAKRLGRTSLQVLRDDRRLMVFPLLSIACSVVIGAVAFAGAFVVLGPDGHGRGLFLVGGLLASYPATFVALFCGVALATVLDRKINGLEATPEDGWRAARARVEVILAWTTVVCTVGALLRLLEEYLPAGGRLAAAITGFGWSLATLFAVPVLAYEGLGPWATLKRSSELVRERWGETGLGFIGIGAFAAVIMLPALVLLVAGLSTHGAAGVALVVIGGAGLLAGQAFTITLSQVYRVFLYRATVHPQAPMPAYFSRDDLDNPFATGRRRW